MPFDEILQALRELYQEEASSSPDGSGPYRFLCPGDIFLSVEKGSQNITFFYTSIAKKPTNSKVCLKLFERLLKGNLFHMATGQGTLSFDESTDLLVYFESLPPALIPSKQELLRATDLFLSYASYWIAQCEKIIHEKEQVRDRKHLLSEDLKLASHHKLNVILP